MHIIFRDWPLNDQWLWQKLYQRKWLKGTPKHHLVITTNITATNTTIPWRFQKEPRIQRQKICNQAVFCQILSVGPEAGTKFPPAARVQMWKLIFRQSLWELYQTRMLICMLHTNYVSLGLVQAPISHSAAHPTTAIVYSDFSLSCFGSVFPISILGPGSNWFSDSGLQNVDMHKSSGCVYVVWGGVQVHSISQV